MSLLELFNVTKLSVLNSILIDMSYDITKHKYYETRKGNAGVPIAYGASYGDYYLGASIISDSNHLLYPYNVAIGLGLGLGNPKTNIGFENSVSIGSVNPFGGEGIAHDSHYGFKLHKQFFLNNSVSIGVENFISTGRNKKFYGAYFLNISQLIPISSTLLVITFGMGSGRFYTSNYYMNSNNNIINDNITPIGFFGSVAYFFNSHFGIQSSYSANIVGSVLFFNPLFFTNSNELNVGIALMDVSKGINESNLNILVSFTNSF